MAADTWIEWCDSTLNFWQGCTRVSEAKNGGGGCDHCYAERMDKWLHKGAHWGPGAPRLKVMGAVSAANSWQRNAAKFRAVHGRDRGVFVNSTSDWLDNEVPIDWLIELLDTVRQCPDLTFLLLSKRIGNWRKRMQEAHARVIDTEGSDAPLAVWVQDWGNHQAPSNVWLGATVVNQAEADRDIPKLLAVPARVRFLSIEPMLGPINLGAALWQCCERWEYQDYGCYGHRPECCGSPVERDLLNWVIAGGESGPGARPAQVQWFHSLRKQCAAAGVPFHMKQLGAVVLDHGMASPGQHWPAGIQRQNRPRFNEDDPGFEVHLRDRKGGDMAEWPEDLRVRDFPMVTA